MTGAALRAASPAPPAPRLKVAVHRLRGSVDALVRDLDRDAVADDAVERRVRTCAWLIPIPALLLIGSCIGKGNGVEWLGWVSLLALGGLIALVVAIVRAKRYDLDDRKLTAARKLLRMLAVDVPADVLTDITLDFRPYRKAGPPLDAGTGGGSASPDRKTYRQEWLTLAGELSGGVRFRVAIADRVGRKEKRKRKYTKVKERARSVVLVSLRPPAGVDLAKAASLLQRSDPPRPLARKRVHAQGRWIAATLATPVSIQSNSRTTSLSWDKHALADADHVLKALVWTYDGVRSAGSKVA